MICILKRDKETKEILGWIVATDIADARRQAGGAGELELEQFLYRLEGPLENNFPAQTDLPISNFRYTLLRG